MSRFNYKKKAVVLFVLLMGLAGLSGCTVVEARTLDVAAADAQVAANAPELRFSPSYYRDDPAVIYGVVPVDKTVELRFSPSYYRDDPTVIYGVVPAEKPVELRFSPSYYRDDPALLGQ